MKKDRSKDRTQRYRERLKEKQEAAEEAAAAREQCARFDLRFFGESGFGRNAQTAAEEIHIHRQFLRALGEPDVLPDETLRGLAKRAWDSLVADQGEVRGTTFFSGAVTRCGGQWIDGAWHEGDDLWITMFNPHSQTFDGGPDWQGYTVLGALRPGWFEEHWQPPADCTGNEPIDTDNLPKLPPIPGSTTRRAAA
jgi:hypothetical protein